MSSKMDVKMEEKRISTTVATGRYLSWEREISPSHFLYWQRHLAQLPTWLLPPLIPKVNFGARKGLVLRNKYLIFNLNWLAYSPMPSLTFHLNVNYFSYLTENGCLHFFFNK